MATKCCGVSVKSAAMSALIVSWYAGDGRAGAIVPIAQERQAGAFVIVPPCGGSDSDSQEALVFGPFQAAVDAVLTCQAAQGIACAVQVSEIGSSALTAWGNVVSSAASRAPTVIHAIPWSRYDVTFQISTPVEYVVVGDLSAEGAAPVVLANAMVRLMVPAGPILFQQIVEPGAGGWPNMQAVDIVGQLGPGTYSLDAQANAGIDSTVPPNGSGMGQFNIIFHAAIPGDVNGDDVVDVDDLLEVIVGWGPCDVPATPLTCPADIAPLGGNDQVDVVDLVKVIINWS